MRKIILVVLIVSIFSFSIVYAQEIYGIDINQNAESNSYNEESINNDSIKEEDLKGSEVADSEVEQDRFKKNEEEPVEQQDEGVTVVSKAKNGQALPEKQSSNASDEEEVDPIKASKKETSKNSSNKNEVEKKHDENQTKHKEESTNVDGSPVIDTGNAQKGSFKAKYLSSKKLKVMVVKDGEKYTYDLKGDNSYQSYPLQLGDGTYKISIMENIGDKQYKYVLTKEVEIKSNNPNDKYLTSVQMINWNNSMSAVKKAKSLTGGLNDKQKVSKIYSYVVSNIKYDSSITSLPSGYVPSINKTYSSRKGICYDFASLFAGMLRSVGVPTKLIKGESTNVNGYHAWNEVYVDGSWHIIDTSYDSQLKEAGHKVSMYKSSKHYSKSKQY